MTQGLVEGVPRSIWDMQLTVPNNSAVRSAAHIAPAGAGLITPGATSRLEGSSLWYRSQAVTALKHRTVAEEEMKRAMRQALGVDDVTFGSDTQRKALEEVLAKHDLAPLVVVLPTGGGKSLLFMALACLRDPGVTVVVVPYRALLDNLLSKAKAAGIDCFEWKRGEVNPAALVFVSADVVAPFMSYARIVEEKRLLRRVCVDESHLTFTSSNCRAKLTVVRLVRGLRAPTIMLTAPPDRAGVRAGGEHGRADVPLRPHGDDPGPHPIHCRSMSGGIRLRADGRDLPTNAGASAMAERGGVQPQPATG